jgi:CheY-like chemotaxis protein
MTTILYVDDDASVHRLVERIVQKRDGVNVEFASTGGTAIARAGVLQPSMIMTDLHLPDTNGLELVRTLRALEVTRATPIVVISGDDDPAVRKELQHAGMNEFITKPFDIHLLMTVIDRYLEPCVVAKAQPLKGDVVDGLRLLIDNSPAAADLLLAFADESKLKLARLRAALADHDSAAAILGLHTLAGSAGLFGATALATRVRILHDRLLAGSGEVTDADIDGLDLELDRAIAALDEAFPGVLT